MNKRHTHSTAIFFGVGFFVYKDDDG